METHSLDSCLKTQWPHFPKLLFPKVERENYLCWFLGWSSKSCWLHLQLLLQKPIELVAILIRESSGSRLWYINFLPSIRACENSLKEYESKNYHHWESNSIQPEKWGRLHHQGLEHQQKQTQHLRFWFCSLIHQTPVCNVPPPTHSPEFILSTSWPEFASTQMVVHKHLPLWVTRENP